MNNYGQNPQNRPNSTTKTIIYGAILKLYSVKPGFSENVRNNPYRIVFPPQAKATPYPKERRTLLNSISVTAVMLEDR